MGDEVRRRTYSTEDEDMTSYLIGLDGKLFNLATNTYLGSLKGVSEYISTYIGKTYIISHEGGGTYSLQSIEGLASHDSAIGINVSDSSIKWMYNGGVGDYTGAKGSIFNSKTETITDIYPLVIPDLVTNELYCFLCSDGSSTTTSRDVYCYKLNGLIISELVSSYHISKYNKFNAGPIYNGKMYYQDGTLKCMDIKTQSTTTVIDSFNGFNGLVAAYIQN